MTNRGRDIVCVDLDLVLDYNVKDHCERTLKVFYKNF